MEQFMLIVDDNMADRRILRSIFEKTYTILEAKYAEEVPQILKENDCKLSLMILDLTMPGLENIKLLGESKQLTCFDNVPIVVITDNGAIKEQIMAFELGAYDFICKPFVSEIVCARISNVLASYKSMETIKKEAQRLKIKSELDQMTGLFNKTTTELAIRQVLVEYPDQLHALLVIDIDNFKSINDIAGHQAGDHTIRIVADILHRMFSKTDIVGRIGGDEFAVLMINLPSMDVVRNRVNDLIQLMRYKPNLTIPENASLSIGFVGVNGEKIEYEVLFRRADEALFLAKGRGKAQAHEYGVIPASITDAGKSAVLLLSRNRNICSIVHAVLPEKLTIVEVLDLEHLAQIQQDDADCIVLAYVDATDIEQEESTIFWQTVFKNEWIKCIPILALCEEGNFSQYQGAIQGGAIDILSVPLEKAALTRRTLKWLESQNKEMIKS